MQHCSPIDMPDDILLINNYIRQQLTASLFENGQWKIKCGHIRRRLLQIKRPPCRHSETFPKLDFELNSLYLALRLFVLNSVVTALGSAMTLIAAPPPLASFNFNTDA